MISLLEHPGWKIFSRDLEAIVEAGVVGADNMFPTNDSWQFWRGKKNAFDYVLNYPAMVETILKKIETNDPSLVFEDEEDPINSLED